MAQPHSQVVCPECNWSGPPTAAMGLVFAVRAHKKKQNTPGLDIAMGCFIALLLGLLLAAILIVLAVVG